MQENKLSILLADDHPLAREGIRSILEKAPDANRQHMADTLPTVKS
jgi:DNA-binding NarL/FixJ family response regulator